MPTYEPIDIAGDVNCLKIDLVSFNWGDGVATFSLPGGNPLRIRFFPGDLIVRMLDEFALSTEDIPSERRGAVGCHFAYRVSGDPFAEAQSKVWRESSADDPLHYRFITGGGCLDVLCHCEPVFEIKPQTSG